MSPDSVLKIHEVYVLDKLLLCSSDESRSYHPLCGNGFRSSIYVVLAVYCLPYYYQRINETERVRSNGEQWLFRSKLRYSASLHIAIDRVWDISPADLKSVGQILAYAENGLKLGPFLSSPVHSGPFAWSRSLLFKGFLDC